MIKVNRARPALTERRVLQASMVRPVKTARPVSPARLALMVPTVSMV